MALGCDVGGGGRRRLHRRRHRTCTATDGSRCRLGPFIPDQLPVPRHRVDCQAHRERSEIDGPMRRNPSGHRERRGKQSKEKIQGRYRSKRPCRIGQPALTYRCIKDGHRRDDADCRHAHTQDASAKEDDQRHPSRELTLPEQGHRRPHHGRQRGDKHHLRVPTEDPQGKHDATKRWRERVPVNRARDHPQQGGEQPVRPRLVQQRGTTYNKEGLTEDQAGKGGLDAGCAPRPGKAKSSHTRQRRRKCNRTVVASLRTTDEQGDPDQGRKPSVLTERDRKAPRYRRRP